MIWQTENDFGNWKIAHRHCLTVWRDCFRLGELTDDVERDTTTVLER
jgi:hypothetical protein